MSLNVVDHGRGNHLLIDGGVRKSSTGTIVLNGNDNSVVIGAGCLLQGASITLGEGCSVRAGENSRLAAIEIVAVARGHVSIGRETNFTWHTRLLLHEAGKITIGSGCLIASDTLLTVSDMHSIIDRKTGTRVNQAADIEIGDRVWLAHAVTVLKGCTVGSGSIVGIGSIVSRDLPAYVLATGRPAKVTREDVSWDAALL